MNTPKIEQCTLNLTFEEEDEFLLEVIGKKYVLFHLLASARHFLSTCSVKSTFPETTLVGRTLLFGPVRNEKPCVDQAPDQVPYNDDSEPESEYALDEVSSDVEMNPEDMVDLPSDEDEDAEWVTHHHLIYYNPC